ncbi:hypothetical protein DRO54_01210 [Candidatus Bathyarchaeota archaeon]|nr:MAG: hypothetical protein DRO54_01210 [Candidatus Bathyarchaeota archaeon]
MEKNVNWKKATKLVILLLSSLFIGVASASLYDYMYLNATVGVEGISLEWINGTDADSAGTQIQGLTATLTNLKGPPNGTRIYRDPVRLNNTGASAVTFNLTISAVTGDTDYLESIIVRIYNVSASEESIGNLTVWSNGATGSDLTGLQIPSNNQFRFQWEITWKATATTSHLVSVELKVQVPVS